MTAPGVHTVMTHLSFIVALFVALLLASSGSCALAQGPAAPLPPEIVLVLDNSGSMKKNDPRRLVHEVVAAFGRSLPFDGRLALIVFGSDARVSLPLTSVEQPEFPDLVFAALQTVDYSAALTDIPAGVERALYELRSNARPNTGQYIVLVTDGIIDVGDPSRAAQRGRWLREDLAEQARRSGVHVFGLALTEAADFELMQSLSQTTHGDYYRVLTVDDVASTFDRVASRIRELSTLPTPTPTLTASPTRTATRTVPPTSTVPPTATAAPSTPVVIVLPQEPPDDDIRWIALGGAGAAILLGLLLLLRTSRPRREESMPKATLTDRGAVTSQRTYNVSNPLRIGRVKAKDVNDVALPFDTVSRLHARIEFRDGQYFVRDLGTPNGTFVVTYDAQRNPKVERVSPPQQTGELPLPPTCTLRFDTYEFDFSYASVPADLNDTGMLGTAIHTPPPASGSASASPVAAMAAASPMTQALPMCVQHSDKVAVATCDVCSRAFCDDCVTRDGTHVACHRCTQSPAA